MILGNVGVNVVVVIVVVSVVVNAVVVVVVVVKVVIVIGLVVVLLLSLLLLSTLSLVMALLTVLYVMLSMMSLSCRYVVAAFQFWREAITTRGTTALMVHTSCTKTVISRAACSLSIPGVGAFHGLHN